MFARLTPILTLLAAVTTYVRADPNPTTPAPGDTFTEGRGCSISWNVDTTGVWKTMNIKLMTGDNFNMVFLALVATVDGTDASKPTFSYPCPQVSPHSPIYFYEFSTPSSENKTWTGRFAITDSSNKVVAPSQSTQPDGENVPWGTGHLVDGSSTALSASGTSDISGTIGASADPSSTLSSSDSSFSSTPAPDTSTQGSVTPTSSDPSVSSVAASSAAAIFYASHIPFQTALALGLAAFGFVVMF